MTSHGDVPEKIRKLMILALLLFVAIGGAPGCAVFRGDQPPLSVSQRYEIASDAYTASINTAIRLKEASVIDTDDLVEFRRLAVVAGDILDDIHERIISGRGVPDSLIDQLEMAIAIMQEFTDERGASTGSDDGSHGSGVSDRGTDRKSVRRAA